MLTFRGVSKQHIASRCFTPALTDTDSIHITASNVVHIFSSLMHVATLLDTGLNFARSPIDEGEAVHSAE